MAFTKIAAAGIGSTELVTLHSLEVLNNATVGGVLTYEDVTNVDSIGIVTARAGVLVGSGITLSKDGDIFATGVTTTGSLVSSGAISGTTGTFTGDVDIADKIIHTGDTNTAIRFPAADTVSVETGGAERLRITSGGDMGLGTNSPSTKLHVQQSAVTSAPSRSSALYLENNGNCEIQLVGNSSNDCQLRFGTSSNSFKGAIEYELDNNNLIHYTNGSERLRIDSSGRVGISRTPTGHMLEVQHASEPTISLWTDTTKRIALQYNSNATYFYSYQDSPILFSVASGNSFSERLKITSGGIIQIGGALSNGTGDLDTSNSKLTIKQSANNQEDGIYIERSGERRGFYAYVGGALSQSDAFGIASQQLGTKTDVLAIDRGGDVAIGAGDLFFSTAGKGIVLGATSNTSANTLSDYETGVYTITATLGSGSVSSYTSNTGAYIKVGSVVHVVGRLHVNTSTSNVTSFSINLPFANESGTERDTSCVCHVIRGNGGDPVQGVRLFRIVPDSSSASMQDHEGNAHGDLGANNAHININFTYFCVL